MTKDEMRKLEQLAIELLNANGFKAKQSEWGVYAWINGVKTEWCTNHGHIKCGIKNNDTDRLLISKSLYRDGIVHYRKGPIRIKPSMAEFQRVIDSMKSIKLK
jgi:hypothetical protein